MSPTLNQFVANGGSSGIFRPIGKIELWVSADLLT